MKIFWSLLFLLTLVSCTQSAKDSAPPTATEVSDVDMDVAKISGPALNHLTVTPVDFGLTTATNRRSTKLIKIKNTSSVAVNMDIVPLSTTTGYSISKNTLCDKTLAANAECSLTILFNNQGLYNAIYHDGIIVISGSNSIAVQFSAQVSGNPYNLSNTGVDKLLLSLDSPFNLRGNPYRNLSVANVGTANSNTLDKQMPAGYVVRLSRCATFLLKNQACSMQLLLENYKVTTEPPPGSAQVLTSSAYASINLVTGVANNINSDNVFSNLLKYPQFVNYQSGYSIIHYQKSITYIKKNNYRLIIMGD